MTFVSPGIYAQPVVPKYRVVGFAGEAEAGKTSCARILESQGYVRMRFAKYLKGMLAAAGMTHEQIDGADKKKPFNFIGDRDPIAVGRDMLDALSVDTSQPNRLSHVLHGRTPMNAITLMLEIDLFAFADRGVTTPRKVMQLLGTEWGRTIHPNFWVMLWKNEVSPILDSNGFVAVDDARFENEVDAIHDFGGVVIQVNAEKSVVEGGIVGHASEAGGLKTDSSLFNEKKSMDVLAARLDGALLRIGEDE